MSVELYDSLFFVLCSLYTLLMTTSVGENKTTLFGLRINKNVKIIRQWSFSEPKTNKQTNAKFIYILEICKYIIMQMITSYWLTMK